MLKEEIIQIMTVAEYAGFKNYVKDKPVVFGTDAEGQPRAEYATSDVHAFLGAIRAAQ